MFINKLLSKLNVADNVVEIVRIGIALLIVVM